MSKKAQVALYSLFAATALYAAALLTFPFDALGRRIEAEAARALPGSTLAVGRIGPALPFGVRFGDITFEGPAKGEVPGARFSVERLRLRPAWLKLLTGKPAVSFDALVLAGDVHGTAVVTPEGRHLDATLAGIQLDDGKMLEGAIGMSLVGNVDAHVDLMTDAKGVVTDGSIDVAIADASLKSGKIMGFAIPAIDLGSPELAIRIEKSEAKIEKLAIRSPDLEADVTGSISLRAEVMQSLIKGSARVKPLKPWLDRNPTIAGMMSFAGSLVKPDKSLEIPLNGTLARPAQIPGFGR